MSTENRPPRLDVTDVPQWLEADDHLRAIDVRVSDNVRRDLLRPSGRAAGSRS